MKNFKKLLYVVVLMFMIGIAGCEQKPQDIPFVPDDGTEEAVASYMQGLIPKTVSESLEFPSEYQISEDNIVYIDWETSNKSLIAKNGVVYPNVFDREVTLTATVYGDYLQEDLVYEFPVLVKGQENLEDYKKVVADRIPNFVFRDVELITRDTMFINYNAIAYITYSSSNPEVFSNDGKYLNTSPEDVTITLSYDVSINGVSFNGTKDIVIEGKKDQYYLDKAVEFLNNKFSETNVVFENLVLPVTDDNDHVVITWQSSDVSILSHTGKLVTFSSNKTAKMLATIKCNDSVATWEKEFRTFNDQEIVDYIATRMHRSEVDQYNMVTAFYKKDNYGFLPFYVQDIALKDIVKSSEKDNTNLKYYTEESNSNVSNFKITTGLKPWDIDGRSQITKTGTYLITVHDTGSTESASWWNEYETSGNDDRVVSWHFTVGDTEIYQHVPLDEVAYHAGDGSTRFGLNDTGVKYQGPDPVITVGADHFMYINGQKSLIPVPIISCTNAKYNGTYATEITPAGIYTCEKNGNYYMNNIYASNYSQAAGRFYISNCGGNRNSVGIETCINKDVDYNQVMRNCANLVAHLLVLFDLEPDAVLQHRNFSGKLCPQVMIENDTWDYFKEMVVNEYIICKYMNNIKFEYTSHNPELLSNTGKILKAVSEPTSVSYTVKITYNGEVKEYNKTTIINPIK